MKRFFSKSTLGIYPEDLLSEYKEKGSLPEDIVEITDEEYDIQVSPAPEGFTKSVSEDGKPILIEVSAQDTYENEYARIVAVRQELYRKLVDPLNAEAAMMKRMGDEEGAAINIEQANAWYLKIKEEHPFPEPIDEDTLDE